MGQRRLAILIGFLFQVGGLAWSADTPPENAAEMSEAPSTTANESASPAKAADLPSNNNKSETAKTLKPQSQQVVVVTPTNDAENANLPPPPSFTNSQSPCTSIPARAPHLALSAKTKTGERYYRVSLGCVGFSLEGDLINENTRLALDEAVKFILGREDVIRIYIDMATFGMDDREAETRFRQQAFGVKKYLTEKGVYSHIKTNRDDNFDPYFPDDIERRKQALAQASQTKPVEKSKPKEKMAPRRDPSKDYAFNVNRTETVYYQDEPVAYRKTQPNRFAFMPLDSIYFPNNGDALTERAKATLDVIADYIQRRPIVDRIIIKGHADETGPAPYNFKLTDRRADAVRVYLLERGVSATLIELVSVGELQPTDENWTRPGRARNRRVELFLVERPALQLSTVPGMEAQERAQPVVIPIH